jgi:hypothetical protein
LFLTAALAALSLPATAEARHALPKHGPAPAPTPAPKPAPTPAPAPKTPTVPQVVPADVSYSAYQITVKHEYAPSGPNANKPQFQGNMARVTATVKYNAATQTYTARDTGDVNATSAFGPAQRTSTNADFNTYSKAASGVTQTLTVSNPGSTPSAGVQLTYVQYGHWRTVKPGGGNFGNTAQNDTYFVFGPKTAKADMPVSGSATYNTYIDGTYIDKNRSYDVDGTGTLTANFGASGGTLSFGAAMTGSGGPGINFGTVNGTGSIATSSSSFSATGSNGTYSMNLAGYFFGPAAHDLGAVFQLKGPGGGNGDGALVGGQP